MRSYLRPCLSTTQTGPASFLMNSPSRRSISAFAIFICPMQPWCILSKPNAVPIPYPTYRLQSSLNSKARQNQHQSPHQPPKERNPSAHLKIPGVVHSPQQPPDHTPRNKRLNAPDDAKHERRDPNRLPVLVLYKAGGERGGEVHGTEEEQRPEDGEAPDVVAVVEVVCLAAVEGERPVE